VDQRLVQDHHLDRIDAYAAALYLFLVTVADARGLSWYGDASIARRLSIDDAHLRRARDDLVRAGLVAYAKPVYQVLALGDPQPLAPPPRHPVADADASASLTAPSSATQRTAARAHLAALHAALGRKA
jgi:hypothetical protein